MTWPDDGKDGAETEEQKHYHDMANEIRDRLYEDTNPIVAEAFARIASDVILRERRRRRGKL